MRGLSARVLRVDVPDSAGCIALRPVGVEGQADGARMLRRRAYVFSAISGAFGLHNFVADGPQGAPIARTFHADRLQLTISSTKSGPLVIESCGRAFLRSRSPVPV